MLKPVEGFSTGDMYLPIQQSHQHLHGLERNGNILLNVHHPDIPFGPIVIKGDRDISKNNGIPVRWYDSRQGDALLWAVFSGNRNWEVGLFNYRGFLEPSAIIRDSFAPKSADWFWFRNRD